MIHPLIDHLQVGGDLRKENQYEYNARLSLDLKPAVCAKCGVQLRLNFPDRRSCTVDAVQA